MMEETLTPLGVGEWHGADPSTKTVREFLRQADEDALKQEEYEALSEADRAAENLRRRDRRLTWMFEKVIRTPTGEKWKGLEDPDGLDELGWVESQDLEAAVTAFLSRRLPGQTRTYV